MRISLRTTRESCATAHDNEKDVPSHRNSASLVHNAPFRETHISRDVFSKLPTGKPGCTWKQRGQKLANYTKCKRRHGVPPTWSGLYIDEASGARGSGKNAVRRHVSLKPVIPAHAGIQTSDFNPVSLDSGFRRNDKKSKRVDGLFNHKRRKAQFLPFLV